MIGCHGFEFLFELRSSGPDRIGAVAAAAFDRGLFEEPDPVACPLGHRGSAGRTIAGGAQPGADRLGAGVVVAQLCLDGADPLVDVGECGLQLFAALLGVLGPGDGLQPGLDLDDVVGEQPGGGVAQGRLHDGGAFGCLGLPAERAELPGEFGAQVGDPVEVGLQSGELAQRLVLAATMLEHAGGLFDEAAALEWVGVQDLVEPALPDDDVHLLAQTGVVEQLLDVEQPGRCAVDGVLAAAGAEQRPGDRHLGVLDRNRTVGVVDRQ